MKNIKTLLLGTVIGLSSLNAFSQGITMPAPSPAASVSQAFGLTKVEINYSSPGVKGRPIWGALVPYDSVWRTGANKCTDITFSTDVMVGGQKVKAGKYGLFTIPGHNSWTIILNSDASQWGAYDYKKSLDIVRFTVSPQMMTDMKERMAFNIDAVSDSAAKITLCWEKMKVSFDVMADTKGMIKKSIDDLVKSDWHVYASAANFDVDNNSQLKQAHNLAQMALNMNDNYTTEYLMAKVIHAEGNNKEALKYATEAKTLGDKDNGENYQNNYKDKIAKLIADIGTPKK